MAKFFDDISNRGKKADIDKNGTIDDKDFMAVFDKKPGSEVFYDFGEEKGDPTKDPGRGDGSTSKTKSSGSGGGSTQDEAKKAGAQNPLWMSMVAMFGFNVLSK